MLDKILLLAITSGTFIGFGCSTVTVKGPLDIESGHIEEIEGIWAGGEEGLILFIKNYDENKVKIGGLDWDSDSHQYILHQDNLILAHDVFRVDEMRGGLLFVQEDFGQTPKDEKDKDMFLFAKYLLSDNNLIAWLPQLQDFKKLIESGEIKGKVNSDSLLGDSVILDGATKLIAKTEEEQASTQNLFIHTHPIIFRKIAPLPRD
jgi:hypothetical protein